MPSLFPFHSPALSPRTGVRFGGGRGAEALDNDMAPARGLHREPGVRTARGCRLDAATGWVRRDGWLIWLSRPRTCREEERVPEESLPQGRNAAGPPHSRWKR